MRSPSLLYFDALTSVESTGHVALDSEVLSEGVCRIGCRCTQLSSCSSDPGPAASEYRHVLHREC